jgi:hypothetical protein
VGGSVVNSVKRGITGSNDFSDPPHHIRNLSRFGVNAASAPALRLSPTIHSDARVCSHTSLRTNGECE